MQTLDMGKVPPVSFGAGRISMVPEITKSLADGPVLIIADAFLAQIGVTDTLAQNFADQGMTCEVAPDIAGEPKDALVDALCLRARDMGAKAIVGLGGGAAMDAAKLVAAIAYADEPAHNFALAAKALPTNGIPAIAIPTTAGTGSEVTCTSVISRADGWKVWFWGPELLFSHVVLDPELTLSLPPHLTAWTGIDAVSHALEAATARHTNAAGQLFGLEALRILSTALPRAVADGSDLEARGQVLWASMVAGLALYNCNTHMGHNISHALGSLVRIHHGHATALGLEVSLPILVARPEGAANYSLAAQAMGADATPSALPEAMSSLMRACNIAPELTADCEHVTAEQLAQAMKSEANVGMARNAACDLSDADLDHIATLMMALPVPAR